MVESSAASYEQVRALEAQTGERYEWTDGAVICIARATLEHSRLAVCARRSIEAGLEGLNCDYQALTSDASVWTGRGRDYVYTDGVFVCGRIETYPGDEQLLANPAIIVEVVSTGAAARRRDFVTKANLYLQMPSLKAYLIVDPAKQRLFSWARLGTDDLWTDSDESVTIQVNGDTFEVSPDGWWNE